MKSTCWTFILTSLLAGHSLAASDPLIGIDFLVGKWRAASVGAAGSDEFRRDLDGHVLQRRSLSVTPASSGQPQSSMETQLTIYPDEATHTLAAIYFDSEGHVIHYTRITVKPGERVEFLSDSAGPDPVFRLRYALKAPGILHVTFEMAPPRQSAYRLIADADETATQ